MFLFELQKLIIDIHLQRTVLVPGDVLTGVVKVKVLKSIELSALRLCIRGRQSARWDEKSDDGKSSTNVTHLSELEHFSRTMTLFGFPKVSGRKGGAFLAPGEYSYFFSILLPTCLPPTYFCSFSGHSSALLYEVVVVGDIPYGIDAVKTLPFTILSSVSIGQLQAARAEPHSIGPVESAIYGCGCCGLFCCRHEDASIRSELSLLPRVVVSVPLNSLPQVFAEPARHSNVGEDSGEGGADDSENGQDGVTAFERCDDEEVLLPPPSLPPACTSTAMVCVVVRNNSSADEICHICVRLNQRQVIKVDGHRGKSGVEIDKLELRLTDTPIMPGEAREFTVPLRVPPRMRLTQGDSSDLPLPCVCTDTLETTTELSVTFPGLVVEGTLLETNAVLMASCVDESNRCPELPHQFFDRLIFPEVPLDIDIELERCELISGEEIRGTVKVTVHKHIDLTALRLCLRGRQRAWRMERVTVKVDDENKNVDSEANPRVAENGRTTGASDAPRQKESTRTRLVKVTEELTHFERSFLLFGFSKASGRKGDAALEPGEYTYGFKASLPECLPPTYYCEFDDCGSESFYEVGALADIPYAFDKLSTSRFTVLSCMPRHQYLRNTTASTRLRPANTVICGYEDPRKGSMLCGQYFRPRLLVEVTLLSQAMLIGDLPEAVDSSDSNYRSKTNTQAACSSNLKGNQDSCSGCRTDNTSTATVCTTTRSAITARLMVRNNSHTVEVDNISVALFEKCLVTVKNASVCHANQLCRVNLPLAHTPIKPGEAREFTVPLRVPPRMRLTQEDSSDLPLPCVCTDTLETTTELSVTFPGLVVEGTLLETNAVLMASCVDESNRCPELPHMVRGSDVRPEVDVELWEVEEVPAPLRLSSAEAM